MSAYQDIVDEAVRFKNRYKSLFRKNGKKIKGCKLYNDSSLLNGIKREDYKFIGNKTFELLGHMEKIRQAYVKEIAESSKKFKEMKYLRSLPGIGLIQAAKIIAQVIEPKRFKNKYLYFSYCGLAKHKQVSGDKLYGSRKIWGNRILKCVYKMAGYSALKGNNGLRKYYDFLRLKGISHKNAYNSVCRKIAATSLCLWRNKQIYNDELVLKKYQGKNNKNYLLVK